MRRAQGPWRAPFMLKNPFKGPRWSRGSYWEDWKRKLLFPDQGSVMALQVNQWFFLLKANLKIEFVTSSAPSQSMVSSNGWLRKQPAPFAQNPIAPLNPLFSHQVSTHHFPPSCSRSIQQEFKYTWALMETRRPSIIRFKPRKSVTGLLLQLKFFCWLLVIKMSSKSITPHQWG